jgi:hypothetical protein
MNIPAVGAQSIVPRVVHNIANIRGVELGELVPCRRREEQHSQMFPYLDMFGLGTILGAQVEVPQPLGTWSGNRVHLGLSTSAQKLAISTKLLYTSVKIWELCQI